jgi:3-oxoacyl-[acyl-carrier-protein] synthase II
MSDRRVVIIGRGVFSSIGCDWPTFAEAVRQGTRAAIAPFPGALPDDPVPYHPLAVDPAAGEPRLEPLAVLATAAVGAALAEAGIDSGDGPLDDVGFVMSTAFGPSTALESYLETLLAKGPRAARPALFVDTLLSMPASRAGIAHRLRGSTAVLGGSDPFEVGLTWLRQGRERTIVAGGADYLSAKTVRHHRELARRSGAGRALLAQGAAFLVLEQAEHAERRGARAIAELLGAWGASEPQDVAVPWSGAGASCALEAAMRGALADASVAPAEVSLVALAAGDDASEVGEAAAVHSVFEGRPTLLRSKRMFGEALGGSGGLSLLAALAALEGSGGVALVNAYEMSGAVSSVVIRAVR